MKNSPDFIIIGAMKCATSTIHYQLNMQPGIYMSNLKEPNFFSDDSQYERGVDWYSELFADASPHEICGESSTHYTKLPTYPDTVSRINHCLPKVKFIYVMRHPIDRLVSQFIHEWSQKTVCSDISRALKTRPELFQYGLYSMQIKPYIDRFGYDRILPVFFENIQHNPLKEIQRICKFIGYSDQPRWVDQFGHQHSSSERLRDSYWRDVLVNNYYLSGVRKKYIPKKIRTWMRSFWQIKNRPQLSAYDKKMLENKYDEDLEILGDWLDLDLSCQLFKETVLNSEAIWIGTKNSN